MKYSHYVHIIEKVFVLILLNFFVVQKICLTLSQTTNFRLFQPKSLQKIILESAENGRKFSERVENSVGKGEFARYEQFVSPPPPSQCFQKTFFTADT